MWISARANPAYPNACVHVEVAEETTLTMRWAPELERDDEIITAMAADMLFYAWINASDDKELLAAGKGEKAAIGHVEVAGAFEAFLDLDGSAYLLNTETVNEWLNSAAAGLFTDMVAHHLSS